MRKTILKNINLCYTIYSIEKERYITMLQVSNIQDLKTAIYKNGEMVITIEDGNIVIMKMEEYINKRLEDEIEEKLLRAEKQIEEGKTIKATEVFKELEELYGF